MAWTQSDLDIIEQAIASRESRVRFSDGREVEYRLISDLLKARDAIKTAVVPSDSPSAGVRSTLATFRKD